jgi:hypothetical protein
MFDQTYRNTNYIQRTANGSFKKLADQFSIEHSNSHQNL